MNEVDKLEKRINDAQAKLDADKKKLRQVKRQQHEKFVKQVGARIVKESGIENLEQLSEYKLVKKDKLTSGNGGGIEAQLRKIADDMQYTGNFWKVKDLSKVTEWLAHFRTENREP